MTDVVTVTVSEGIGHIELNRPAAANGIDMSLATALHEAVRAVRDDDAVKAVLVTGAGKRFCAGGDVVAFAEAEEPREFLQTLAETADAAVQELERLEKPVVAAVHGAVAGAGLGIMLAADVIVAAEGTKFAFAYPAIGLTPDCGVSVSLPRAMGLQRALAFALSPAPLSAPEAQAAGLVTEVCEDPAARAREVAAGWASAAPGALGAVRSLLRLGMTRDRAEAGSHEAELIGARAAEPEAEALISAFLSR